MHHAGAVEQDIDRTRIPRRVGDRRGIEDIQASGADLVRLQTAQLCGIDIGGDDLGSGGGEGLSGRPPHPLARSRDEGCLTSQ